MERFLKGEISQAFLRTIKTKCNHPSRYTRIDLPDKRLIFGHPGNRCSKLHRVHTYRPIVCAWLKVFDRVDTIGAAGMAHLITH